MNADQVGLCADCRAPFHVSEKESAFLEKISPQINSRVQQLPLPEHCPACREQQRLAFRNEWNLFRRRCDATGKEIISIFSPQAPYPIYEPETWWSDAYDPLHYGREFDFSRTFFEQFHDLNLAVPKAAIQNAKSENSAYTNYSAENKNCYLCMGSTVNEDCYYCYRVTHSKRVCDSYDLQKCECCYECLQCTGLYGCIFSRNCHNSSALTQCDDCWGCHDCFGCRGLRNKSFCIFNEEVGEKDYREMAAQLMSQAGQAVVGRTKIEDAKHILNSEACSGDQLINCSRCESSFTLKECQDCCYFGSGEANTDCYDCNFSDNGELQYFSTNLRYNYRVIFGALVWYCNETAYSMNCFNSSNLFGCTGMKRHSYCVLNKQYDSENYSKLAERIIAHMKETQEWGRYFPGWVSPFPYNCSVAQEYYPLTSDSASKKGRPWLDAPAEPEEHTKIQLSEPAYSGAVVCSATGKPFKITKQERELCELLGIGLPTKCPDVRRTERMKSVKRALRNYC